MWYLIVSIPDLCNLTYFYSIYLSSTCGCSYCPLKCDGSVVLVQSLLFVAPMLRGGIVIGPCFVKWYLVCLLDWQLSWGGEEGTDCFVCFCCCVFSACVYVCVRVRACAGVVCLFSCVSSSSHKYMFVYFESGPMDQMLGPMDQILFKEFPFFSSGGYFVRPSRTI